MTPPCKDCERKGCGAYHERCGKYLMWKVQRKREEEARQAKKKVDDFMYRKKKRGYLL